MPHKNKILLIDTNYPINSRNQRIVDSLSNSVGSENVRVVTWYRDEAKNIHSDSEYVYSHPSPLGDKWAKLKALRGYRNYIKKIIYSYNPKIIIASHWDSLLLASTIKKTNQILIYENLDIGNKCHKRSPLTSKD